MLDELHRMTSRKYLIPMQNLDVLLGKFADEKYSAAQALLLIDTCSTARYHTNHDVIMAKCWGTLAKQKHLLTPDHYKVMMSFYSKAGRPIETEALFAELIDIGFTPNS